MPLTGFRIPLADTLGIVQIFDAIDIALVGLLIPTR